MMGGKIWVESEVDKGSRFIFKVKMPVAVSHQENTMNQAGSLSGKVLVVDDNESIRRVLKSYISYVGAEVSVAGDAVSAMEFLANQGTGQQCNLMIVDAEMPSLDGFRLIKNIKEQNHEIPAILMLNPATLNQNQKNLEQLGHSQIYLTKPIKKKELYQQIENVLSDKQGKKLQAAPVSDEAVIKSLNILLVDDNPDNRLLVNAYLKKLPYVLEEAENGEEAVEKFMRSYFDIVLMDVQMPVMDGREATRKIRAWEKQQGKRPVPIIALTAHAIKEEIDMCIEAGCDSHLSKPVKKSTLISTIQAFVA